MSNKRKIAYSKLLAVERALRAQYGEHFSRLELAGDALRLLSADAADVDVSRFSWLNLPIEFVGVWESEYSPDTISAGNYDLTEHSVLLRPEIAPTIHVACKIYLASLENWGTVKLHRTGPAPVAERVEALLEKTGGVNQQWNEFDAWLELGYALDDHGCVPAPHERAACVPLFDPIV